MISVLILTRNEEQDLPGCLDSVSWSDDIHVFDSESTDRTAAIARICGAKVTTRRFDGYARQRNAARNFPFATLGFWFWMPTSDRPRSSPRNFALSLWPRPPRSPRSASGGATSFGE